MARFEKGRIAIIYYVILFGILNAFFRSVVYVIMA